MSIIYPPHLPCVSRIEGHSAALSAGLVRTPMNAGNTRQRRTFRTLPHMLALVFVIEQKVYAEWLAWVNVYAWDEWVSMKLPGLLASRLGTDTASIQVKFCTDLQAELLPVHRLWYWRVRVTAEYIPTPEHLAPVLSGDWIVAGTPGDPSPDWIVAGTPAAPSPDWISAGTALLPASF
jgi:hypothetical protein